MGSKKKQKTLWQKKQKLAAPSRYYGNGGTIHASSDLDVVMNEKGVVTEVWFRCQQLPFTVSRRGDAQSPGGQIYRSLDDGLPLITGVEVLDASTEDKLRIRGWDRGVDMDGS